MVLTQHIAELPWDIGPWKGYITPPYYIGGVGIGRRAMH